VWRDAQEFKGDESMSTKKSSTLAVIISAVLLMSSSTVLARIKIGAPAPALQAVLLDGQKFWLDQHKGHVVLINFWATWCPPCLKEMPELDRLYREHHTDGLDIIGISMDDTSDSGKVHSFVKNLHYPIALQQQADVSAYGRIWAVPLLFIIDRRGVLHTDGWPGLSEKDFPALEKTIKDLLAASP
jgi:thiol-disulfide isomerase/thioredoxin